MVKRMGNEQVNVTLDSLKQEGDIYIMVGENGVSLRFPNETVIKTAFGEWKPIQFRMGPMGILRFSRLWRATKINEKLYRIEVRNP